jgi:hypothetical protein
MAATTAERVQPKASDVEAVIASYPKKVQPRVRRLRKLILNTAASIPEVGPITETLKWGEPAYLTEKSKSGSTIRMAWKPAKPGQYALYLNCQTTLVDTYRTLFPELQYEGNRAVVFDVDEKLPEESVRRCIELALTYHLAKKAAKKRR